MMASYRTGGIPAPSPSLLPECHASVVIAIGLLLVVAITALLGAASLKLRGLAPTLVAAYVIAVAEVTGLVLVLSPSRSVTRTWLAVGELIVLALVLGAWWGLGRPGIPFAGRGAAIRAALRDPVVAILAAVVAAALLYELTLGLTMPPNNWDSLTYHLSRAAAWFQHGGLYWIPNAPTDRVNEFQPGAEQLLLYLFVATNKGALWALPQFLAQIATIVGIYIASRRLGFEVKAAFCAALLFATFALVALESTTAQNDLVVASLAVVGASLLLGRTVTEDIVAGVAVGLSLGVKLTVAIVVPVLVALAALGGRKALARFALAGIGGFALFGVWGYLLNIVHTDRLLGYGQGRVENTAHPSFPGSVSTGWRVLYRFVDLSAFSTWMLVALGIAGAASAVVVLALRRRELRGGRERCLLVSAVGAPFLVPVIALGVAWFLHHAANLVHLPVHDEVTTSSPFSWTVNWTANEDFSAFGPLGIAVVATSVVLTVVLWRRRDRLDRLVLALALPFFIVVLALSSKYNPWLSRFLIAPLALTVPLLATWFRRREAAIGVVAVACTALVVVHLRNQLKPIESAATPPWELTQVSAVDFPWINGVAPAIAALERRVPADACVGALLDPDDPTYLLYGRKLKRRLAYLKVPDEEKQADERSLTTILVKTNDYQDAQNRMRANGWTLHPLSIALTVANRPGTDSTPSC